MYLYHDDDMMCISLFSYGRLVVVRCMGVRLGMGWVGSVNWWVGLGWVDENRPTDNSALHHTQLAYRPNYIALTAAAAAASPTQAF